MVRSAVFIGPASFGAPGAPGEWPALDRVPERIAELTAAFQRLGYACSTVDGQLGAAGLGSAVRDAMDRSDPADVLVVHVFSHGEVTASGALHVIGADGVRHEFTDVERWLRNVVDAGPAAPTTLFLLDICYAGEAARFDWLTRTGSADGRAWVIAACAPYEQAYAGRFTDAVTEVLGDLAAGRLDIDESVENAPITTIAQQIRRDVTRRAIEADGMPQQVTASLIDISSTPPDLPFFPNPRHSANPRRAFRSGVDTAAWPFLDDVDEALDPAHFIGRAAGRTATEGAGCFSGRGDQVKQLAPWLNLQDRVGLRVVTGSPGAGKSALIGVLVCAAHPALRDHTKPIWDRLKQRPYPNYNMAVVHAREHTPAHVTASIARQLRVPADDLAAGLAARDQAPLIVLDALDEATDGKAIMNEVLLPLTRATRADGQPIRVLVGMRPWEEFRPLREAAEAAGGLHDLDQVDAAQLCNDVEEYVDLLIREDDRWSAGARAEFARAVAVALTLDSTDRTWGAFLVAGLFTHHVLHTHTERMRDIDQALALAATVPLTLPGVLELDLARSGSRSDPRQMLSMLAYAKGNGMPAALIADIFGDRQLVIETLQQFAFYLRRSVDVDGTTLYRLFHQGLADDLADERWIDPIAAALFASVTPRPGAARRWELAAPYTLRHIPAHARAADMFWSLIADAGFLVAADPAMLRAELTAVPVDPGFSGFVDAYLATGATRGPRRQELALQALRFGAPDLAQGLAALPGPEPMTFLPLWRVEEDVTAVATGDSVAVLGTAGGDVIVRDLVSGDLRRKLARVHPIAVRALSTGSLRGRPAALSSANDQMLTVSPLDGAGESTSITIGGSAVAVTPGEIGGREMVTVLDKDGTAAIWDLTMGVQVARLLWKLPMADCFRVGEDAVELYRDRTDPSQLTARLNGNPFVLAHDAVVTAAAGTAAGAAIVIFTGDAEGLVTAWDLDHGTRFGSVRLPGPVIGLHATDGSDLLAGTEHEVFALRFQPPGATDGTPPVRHNVLYPSVFADHGPSLRWGQHVPAPVAKPEPAQGGGRHFRYASLSVAGGGQTLNCDAAYAGPHLLAVADGYDPQPGAAEASRTVITAIAGFDHVDGSMPAAIGAAENRLLDAATSDAALSNTGTTLTAMIISGGTLQLAHLGDSRIYLLRGGQLTRLTTDTGSIGAAASATRRPSLLRAAGPEFPFKVSTHRTEPGDRYLLCTRGLTDAVDDSAIAYFLGRYRDPIEGADRLINAALKNNASQNVTVVLGEVVEG